MCSSENRIIRLAESSEDFEEVRELFEEYAASLGFDLDFQDFDNELHDLPGPYARPDGCVLLARVNSEAAGCVALRKLAEGICEMKRLYVRPPFREKGIGRLLSLRVVAEARARGYARMRLDTLASMTTARSLYRSMGFEEIKPYRFNPFHDAVFMELIL
jgi:putative acetyltransferase